MPGDRRRSGRASRASGRRGRGSRSPQERGEHPIAPAARPGLARALDLEPEIELGDPRATPAIRAWPGGAVEAAPAERDGAFAEAALGLGAGHDALREPEARMRPGGGLPENITGTEG